jgi:serine/threonine protein kinase
LDFYHLLLAFNFQTLLQAILGLSFLHFHHKIHRDIKSDNFLIDLNGTIKLGIFSLVFFFSLKVEESKVITAAGSKRTLAMPFNWTNAASGDEQCVEHHIGWLLK